MNSFEALAALTRVKPTSRIYRAIENVMLRGVTPHAAAIAQGIKPAGVYATIKRMGAIRELARKAVSND